MSKPKRKNAFKDDLDGEYIGNVFGWKVSIIGLIVIAAFVGLYFFLSKMNQNNAVRNKSNQSIQIDSTLVNESDTIDLQ